VSEDKANEDRYKLKKLAGAAGSALRIHHEFMQHPIRTSRILGKLTKLSNVYVNKTLDHLCKVGVLKAKAQPHLLLSGL